VFIDAGAGDDVITLEVPPGGSGVRWGGGGIVLRGGAGADSYQVSRSGVRAGQVLIDDRSQAGERNSLVLGFGYSSSSIRLAYGSLVIGFVDDGLEIHLVNFDRENAVDGVRDIDTFVFSDGTMLSYPDIVGLGFDVTGSDAEDVLEGSSAVDRLYGLAGDDLLDAGAGDDLLVGGPGSDELHGGAGDDVYRLELGDGSDVLVDAAGDDSIRFGAGIVADGLRLGREGDDLRIGYGEAGSVLIQRWFDGGLNRIERFEFDDGTSLADDEIEQRLAPPLNSIEGTDGGDLLSGTPGGDGMEGFGGDDLLLGLAGGDRLRGGSGDDAIFGGRGDDLLVGGAGNDRLAGGRGNDEYRFAAGDGADRIQNASWSGAADVDVLRFGQGLTPDRLWFSRQGYDLVAQVIGSRDRVSVAGWFADDTARIDRVVAGDGEAILADQLDRLVGALAAFGVDRAPVVELSPAQQDAYSAMIASYWEAPAEGGARMAG
jgi:Ca2+-binding RTX toxin-like protein